MYTVKRGNVATFFINKKGMWHIIVMLLASIIISTGCSFFSTKEEQTNEELPESDCQVYFDIESEQNTISETTAIS